MGEYIVNKTLYISDLDGTLLNGSAELSEYTTAALNALIAKGLHFTVATARTAASALTILDGVEWNIPLVLMNGVLIYDTKQKLYIQTHALAAETAMSVITLFKSLGVTGLMYQLSDSEQKTYYETLEHKPLRDFVEERISRYNKKFLQTNSFSDIPPEQIIYFTLLDTLENIQRVHNELSSLTCISYIMYKDNYSPDLWYLEIHSDKASKQSGTNYLREAYDFDRVIGFGDNLNDLPMFEACDVRVAVDNAKPEVKAAAGYICGSNNTDGVARWLEENVL